MQDMKKISQFLASASTFSPDIHVHKTDFSPSPLASAFRGTDSIISAVATAGVESQLAIIDAAAKAKVKRFIPSEYGGDSALLTLDTDAPFAVAK